MTMWHSSQKGTDSIDIHDGKEDLHNYGGQKHTQIMTGLLSNRSNIKDKFGIDLSDENHYNFTNDVVETAISGQFSEVENGENVDSEKITSLMFQVVFLTVIGVFGLIGNISIIMMFSKNKKQLTFHRLMMMLSICDTFVILLSFLIFALPQLSKNYNDSCLGYIAPIVFPTAKIALTASIYSTLAIAIERYLIICHPFYAISHRWPAKRYILFILIFSITYNVPRFFSLETVPCIGKEETSNIHLNSTNAASRNFTDAKEVSNCIPGTSDFRPTPLRLNYYYYTLYLFWMDLLIMEALPIIVLIVLNMYVLQSFRKKLKNRLRANSIAANVFNTSASLLVDRRISDQRNQHRNKTLTIEHIELGLAKLSLTIVFIFIFCHSFKMIPNIYELIFAISRDGELEESWVRSIIHFSNFLIVLCCSSNFYVYCFTHLNIGSKMEDWWKNTHSVFKPEGKKHVKNEAEQNICFPLTSITSGVDAP